jgi:hypothetical protein
MLQKIRSRLRNASAARNLFSRVERSSDPFSHPALKAMSERELADIPFPRFSSSRARPSQRAE